jgi:hypothetical protein
MRKDEVKDRSEGIREKGTEVVKNKIWRNVFQIINLS